MKVIDSKAADGLLVAKAALAATVGLRSETAEDALAPQIKKIASYEAA